MDTALVMQLLYADLNRMSVSNVGSFELWKVPSFMAWSLVRGSKLFSHFWSLHVILFVAVACLPHTLAVATSGLTDLNTIDAMKLVVKVHLWGS